MSTSSNTRIRAALHVEKTKILLLLAAAEAIFDAMSAAVGTFTTPSPALAIVQTQTTALNAAQRVVSSRAGGEATATRNRARDALWASLQSEKAYVQAVADANEPDAVAIIKSGGFDVALPLPPRDKPVLAAKLTVTPGAVKLVGNARALTGGSRKRVGYNWEYSVNGGLNWVPVPGTGTATTTVSGLPRLTDCSFRVCVTLAGVVQPWSQVVTIAVT